ncbi:putative channel/filament protein [Escherichia coli H605]|uniref:Channel/filament protein n=1 Tax=Escherichia coli H605 TaxID=656410 RepID=A0AAJ3NXT1_ECOLX|nr:putative channel/filament protein [Escherichia coli H605]
MFFWICRFIASDVLPRETKKYIATHGNLRAPFLT